MEDKFPQVNVWLHRVFALDPQNRVRSDEVYQLFTTSTGITSITHSRFGSMVKKAFPCIRQVRQKVSSKYFTLYEGIGFVSSAPEEKENIIHISEMVKLLFVAEMGFFVMKSEKESCELGFTYAIKINDTPVLAKLIIKDNITLDIQLILFGKSYNSKEIGTEGLSSTSKNLEAVLKHIKSISFCQGYRNKYCESTTCLAEKLENDKSEPFIVYRSAKCKRLLLCDGTTSVCKICQRHKNNRGKTKLPQDYATHKNNQDTFNTKLPQDCTPKSQAHVTSHSIPTDDTRPSENRTGMEDLIEKLFPGLEEKSGWRELLNSQMVNRDKTEKRRYRWSARIIKLCLMLWGRSPRGYEDLRNSGVLILPTTRLLQYYKNSVKQKPGLQQEMLQWMKNEADKLHLNSREGGLIFDEMSIQEDFQIEKDGTLCGLSNLGNASKAMSVLKTGKDEAALATHVLQLVFLGDLGFRFPFSHYPCRESTATDLFHILWESVGALRDYGFRVNYISMDGASANRSLMHTHFEKTTVEFMRASNFQVPNPMPPNNNIVFLMDPSHCFKKIRNNVLKSGTEPKAKRNLQVNGQHIHWMHWIKAYKWDCYTNSMRIHQKLTSEHIFPDSAQKMRNHLAEEVLDGDMLYLMQSYQRSLNTEENGKLNSVIQFLTNTAKLLNIMRDHRPIFTSSDERLAELQSVHSWFLQWEEEVLAASAELGSRKERTQHKKRLMSDQTREDLSLGVLGFIQLVKNVTERELPGSLVPARVNTDVVENVFCQQRGLHHGNTTNPSYHTYSYGINTILLGQSSVSTKRKSNCGNSAPDMLLCTKRNPLRRPTEKKHIRV